jgi:hypothetical protein
MVRGGFLVLNNRSRPLQICAIPFIRLFTGGQKAGPAPSQSLALWLRRTANKKASPALTGDG